MSSTRTEPQEAGFTLVEMMVATALLGLLFTVVLSALLPLLTFSANTTNGTNDVGEVQAAMDIVSRDIRSSLSANGVGPVISGTATSLTVVTNTGTATADPEVTFTLTGTTLSEADYAATAGVYAATPYRTQTLSSHIDLPAGTSLFTYQSAAPAAIAAPLTATTAPNVASVVVNMVDDGGQRSPNQATLTQQVWIRSVTYGSEP